MDKKPTLWQRLRDKYRIVVVNEKTLGETMHMRLSLLNLILLFSAMTLITLVLFGLLIWFTPLRNYLPGNTQSIREQLVEQNARMDSLLDVLHFQDEYMSVVKSVIAGEIEPDSVNTGIDSMYIVNREELLSEDSEVIDEFMADYEARSKENLSLFDQAASQSAMHMLFRPVSGVVVEHFNPNGFQGVRISVTKDQHVDAVLNGTIVSAQYSVQDGWTMIIQHNADYLSVYSRVARPLHRTGDYVRAGETIGLASDETLLGYQLWCSGRALDPEAVIAF